MVKDRKLYDVPVILAGDFNIDLNSPVGSEFQDFFFLNWGLVLSNKLTEFTTRNQTFIDGVLTCRLDKLTTRRLVSYFSHHRPLIRAEIAGRDASNDTVNVEEIDNLP